MEHNDSTLAADLRHMTGRQLLAAVRAGFIVRGTSLRAWCLKNGIHPQNARACIVGSWSGPKANILRARLCRAAGVRQ